MANIAAVLASTKSRLGITSASFDAVLTDMITAAVSRLYPRAGLEVDAQNVTSFTVSDLGEVSIDLAGLATPIRAARQIEAYDGTSWQRITDTFHHADKLRIREVDSSITKFRIYGVKQFAAIDNVYDWLLQAVYWYAMAEFYDYLAGNKRQYNIYMQSSGARAVDNMRDESSYFDTKADRYIEEQNTHYGQ